MRRVLALIALGGCASMSSPPTTAREPAIFEDKQGVVLGERARPATTTFAAPPVAVWLAAKRVYSGFEIPVMVDNPPAHQLGNNNFFRTGKFANHPMTELLDCGHGMSGANAANFRIFISLLTEVSGDSTGGTNVRTTFVATGQDMSGSSTERVPCGSTGRFEQIFLARLKAEVGSGK